MSTRTRTKDSEQVYSEYLKHYTSQPAGRVLIDSNIHTVDWVTSAFTDTVTPNYHQVIQDGGIVNNDGTGEWYETFESLGSYDAFHTDGRTYDAIGPVCREALGLHQISPYENVEIPNPQPLIDHAKQQALANVDQTPYGFGEDLGELKETIRFLKSPGRLILRLAKAAKRRKAKIRRRKIKEDSQYFDAINDSYLTYRFAASPLYRSVMDAIEAYRSNSEDRNNERYSARGYASDGENFSGNVHGNFNADVYDVFFIESECTIAVRANILYTHSGNRNTKAFLLGLRGKDIPSTAWELVPLSFMVDRVVDISSAIRGLTNLADPRLKILAASVSVKTNIRGTALYINQVRKPSDGWSVTTSGETRSHNGSYSRQTWSPSIIDTVPVFRPTNLIKDAQSIADLFSLTAGILRRSF